jgi:hypothetical protein
VIQFALQGFSLNSDCLTLVSVVAKSMPLANFLLILVGIATSGQSARTTDDGLYSKLAIPVWAIARMPLGLASPDGSSVIHAKEVQKPADGSWPFNVWITHRAASYRVSFGGFVNAEVSWSPDSSAFFVTYSDSGAIGQYHMLVYQVAENGAKSVEPISDGSKLFKMRCFTTERPNVGGIQWGLDATTIFIGVEIPPVSDCASMGTFRIFEIALPTGKVLRTIGQLEAKEQFRNSLGKELSNADDNCIRQPNTCVPPGLEPTAPPKHNQH